MDNAFVVFHNSLQQSSTAFLYILPGGIKVTCVPWIGYLAWTVGKIHQQVHFVVEVATTDSVHTLQVGLVYANHQIKLFVMAVCELAGYLARVVDTMLGQPVAGKWITRIADFLGVGGSRFEVKLLFQTDSLQ